MEWFLITRYGPQDPIKHMMRLDYVEPTQPTDLVEFFKQCDRKKSFASVITDLDVYLGQADGYAYKSYERLIKMRKKGIFKPVGPCDMYRYQGCTSMDYGWFLDNKELQSATWHKVRRD